MEEEVKKGLEGLKSHLDTKMSEMLKDVESKHNDRLDTKMKEEINAITKLVEKKEEDLKSAVEKLDAKMQKGLITDRQVVKSFEALLSEGFSGDDVMKRFKEEGKRSSAFMLKDITGAYLDNIRTKAVGTMSEAASLTGEVIPPTRRESIVEIAQRPVHVRSLLPSATMTSNTFRYVQENAGEGTADVTGEGATKNQVDYDLAAVDAPVTKITAFAKVTEEMLDDIPALTGFLGRRLTKDIRKKEDQQLLYGTGLSNQLTGLSINATTFAAYEADTNAQIIDLLISVYATLESLEYEASGVLLSPKDYYTIYRAKDADGAYVKQDLVATVGGQLFIAGIPVFRNTAVAQGEYFVGDWLNGAQIFDRMGVNVRFYDQDEDNAQKNLITVVAEERLAFPIFYADSFVYGTIKTDIDKIKNFT